MTSRREDARISREYQAYIEALAVIVKKLDVAESANDETTYSAIYNGEWMTIQANCFRSVGKEMGLYIIQHAYTLGRA